MLNTTRKFSRTPVYAKEDGKDKELDKLKFSGCFRAETSAENYTSVIKTAAKNRQNPCEVLRVIANLVQT